MDVLEPLRVSYTFPSHHKAFPSERLSELFQGLPFEVTIDLGIPTPRLECTSMHLPELKN